MPIPVGSPCEEVGCAVERAPHCVKIAIAAAEERGRRAGIEERDALRAALGVLLDSVDYTSGACTVTEMVGAVLPMVVIVRARAALAPRGSGKEPAKMDAPGGPRCWCGRLSVSESGWCGGCESPTEPA